MKSVKKNKILKYQNVILVIAVLMVVSFMTVGFAAYGAIIRLGGNVALHPDGKLLISNISIVDTSNVTRQSLPTIINETTIEFDVGFGGTANDFYITYEMDIINDTSYDYVFSEFDFNPIVHATNGNGTGTLTYELEGISQGDIVRSKTTKTFRLKLILIPDDPTLEYDASGTTEPEGTTQTTGQILASVTPTSINLQGNNDLVEVTIAALSTYTYDISFTMASGNGNFSLVDSNGNALGSFTLPANSDNNTYKAYVKKVPGAMFSTNSTTTTVILQCGNLGNVTTNSIDVAVDIYVAPDEEPPHIGTVTLTPSTTDAGYATVTWSRTDQGGKEVQSYHVLIYKSDGTKIKEEVVSPNTFSKEFTDLYTSSWTDGAYYAVVYGIDEDNDGNDYCPAGTNNEYCRKSANATFDWLFNVTHNSGNFTYTGDSTAILGREYKATITTSGLYSINTVTIKMNNNTLSQGTTGATYRISGNDYIVNKVNGTIDYNITTSGCLKAGTKILLANGKYKNVEDIQYDDLLSVWNYDTGEITYTYPAFIENVFNVNNYMKTTFSDGSILETFDSHGIFSYDLNRYILTTDSEYKVGARIVKIVNGKIKVVTIKKIEIIYEKVKVYHIVSNGYFNVIANDVLTTDPNIMISNQYGFVDNVKWPDGTRDIIIRNKDNLYDYSLFADIMPYYMFRALRVDEGKFVVDQGYISFELLKYYLASNPANTAYFKDLPKNNNGKRLLTVTTSLDNVNPYNKYKYVYEEGSYYNLPVRNNVKCYMNTTNNTCYTGGSKIKINTSTHFIAINKHNY